MNVAFFGTPAVSQRILEYLTFVFDVTTVVTAPDRPAGRNLELMQSPVKEFAAAKGIRVLEPESLRKNFEPPQADIYAVVAYGQILPKQVLDAPRLGCINLHFSLLPALRGAAPVQWALINGLHNTGVTTIAMDEGMDTGPIIDQHPLPIQDDDNAGTLAMKLANPGLLMLIAAIDRWRSGDFQSRPQVHSLATYAPSLTTADARIDWNKDSLSIANRCRAFAPSPGAWTRFRDKRVKMMLAPADELAGLKPGEINGGIVGCGEGTNATILSMQMEGRNQMSVQEFARGQRIEPGERFE